MVWPVQLACNLSAPCVHLAHVPCTTPRSHCGQTRVVVVVVVVVAAAVAAAVVVVVVAGGGERRDGGSTAKAEWCHAAALGVALGTCSPAAHLL